MHYRIKKFMKGKDCMVIRAENFIFLCFTVIFSKNTCDGNDSSEEKVDARLSSPSAGSTSRRNRSARRIKHPQMECSYIRVESYE
mmetsp:Transcript_41239/g.68900  ORF Transcript_41239/g.68900 Transcript_41239/m.68900 type:complete len:85 (-) Transcript_41239:834-1088(-)